MESKYFPIREDPFSEGRRTQFDRVVSRETEPISLKITLPSQDSQVKPHISFFCRLSENSTVSHGSVCKQRMDLKRRCMYDLIGYRN